MNDVEVARKRFICCCTLCTVFQSALSAHMYSLYTFAKHPSSGPGPRWEVLTSLAVARKISCFRCWGNNYEDEGRPRKGQIRDDEQAVQALQAQQDGRASGVEGDKGDMTLLTTGHKFWQDIVNFTMRWFTFGLEALHFDHKILHFWRYYTFDHKNELGICTLSTMR